MTEVHTIAGALIAGLVTSVHCVGMCGPLACGLSSLRATETQRQLSIVAYHASRLTAYSIIGAICGGLGRQPLKWFFDSPLALLPWVLVALLVFLAFGLERKLPKPIALLKFTTRMRFRLGRLSPVPAGLALGLMTPILPCGPLYLLFGASMLSGSAIHGATFALAFGIGTVPLLWLAQDRLRQFQQSLNPATLNRVKRSLALVTAIILAFRLHGTLPFGEPKPTAELPSCCHP